MTFAFICCTCALMVVTVFAASASNIPRLEKYNVDKTKISVSGIGSGASFATQYHVIYSKDIMGAGLIAGTPYYCSMESEVVALVSCVMNLDAPPTEMLTVITRLFALQGAVDSPNYLKDDRIYIFNGQLDSVVKPDVGTLLEQYYTYYVISNSSIKTVFNVSAEHGMPTQSYGEPCRTLSRINYLNNCNYGAAFELLNHIYGGNLKKPNGTTVGKGKIQTFDQGDFYTLPPTMYGMDNLGYVYVPSNCMDRKQSCKLHIAFHGCFMGRKRIGDVYVKHAGYNEVAEMNNIIILYPQAIALPETNPHGCWDWWGYSTPGQYFATNNGYQPATVRQMMDRITG